MIKHSFKIGDIVKLRNGFYCGIYSKDTGKVAAIKYYVEVMWSGELRKRLNYYPHKPEEIEHAVKVGEQLMFSFMSEATK